MQRVHEGHESEGHCELPEGDAREPREDGATGQKLHCKRTYLKAESLHQEERVGPTTVALQDQGRHRVPVGRDDSDAFGEECKEDETQDVGEDEPEEPHQPLLVGLLC